MNPKQVSADSTQAASHHDVVSGTRAHSCKFRSATVGYARLLAVGFGKAPSGTLQCSDVKRAFGSLVDSNSSKVTSGLPIFDL